ncbi:MAG: 2-succinyl-5-enolpyruvyl-6-hydroxy-3-cyclohexene-1-carboxylic-acid synthase [Chloroflexi bacterium]|nr:2-succinyl-5-enolpyruvyl-6-hydroxy-3-cyclohexene-1-carboxylic-acid synthase [Chloroflexota bacterium]
MFENRNYAFAGAFVDELARRGLRHVCFCPGSRSSPLTISFARHPAAIKMWSHLDERSSAFFALGIARSLKEPVALVCSSGTAAANFFPAVVEAHFSLVPLLILTADRPPELHDWGALQTIDQTRMYGSHAKWSVDMPPPEATSDLMGYIRSMACRAFFTAASSPAGPVHVNFPFREPLEPVTVEGDLVDGLHNSQDECWGGRADGRPYVEVVAQQQRSPVRSVERIREVLTSAERGLIVCGPQTDPHLAEAVVSLAHRLDYPVLADVLSQVRCGPHDRSRVIDRCDAFLRDEDVAGSLAPEVVLRLGALPVSKPLAQYLERHRTARHILVGEDNVWADPFRLTSETVHVDAALFCTELAASLDGHRLPGRWSSRWRRVADASRAAMGEALGRLPGIFEGKVFTELAQHLPQDSLLFAGNSMSVRDMDSFFPSMERRVRFLCNRGASGIDGIVSTALGAGAVSQAPLVLVLGDISFYHDMNGLLAARAHGLSATIIVINNNGGGIFSFLPQSAYPDVFEPYFGTPHGLSFRAAADLYGLGYSRVEGWQQFNRVVSASVGSGGTTIIEVPTGDRTSNVDQHRQVWKAVSASVHALVDE